MTELDSATKALFGAARDALAPPAGAEERVFSKLSAVSGLSALTLAASSSASAKPMASIVARLSGAVVRLLPTAHAIPIAAVTLSAAAIGLWTHEHGAQRQLALDVANHRATGAISAKFVTHNVAPPIVRASALLRSDEAAPKPMASQPAFAAEPALEPPAVRKSAMEGLALVAERHLASPASSLGIANRASNLSSPSNREVLPNREATDVKSEDVAASSVPKGSSASVADDSQAVTEMILIGRMHSAWRSGDMRQVAENIAEHQEHFPRGMFTEEREAIRAVLGCRQDTTHASDIASDFERRYVRSAYQVRVNVACGVMVPDKPQ